MNNHYHIPSLRELYPWANEAELQEIGERLDRYVLRYHGSRLCPWARRSMNNLAGC